MHAASISPNATPLRPAPPRSAPLRPTSLHPQNLIATKSPSSTVFVFDVAQHGALAADSVSKPQFRCLGHTQEGYGLAWSPHKEGRLVSGSHDKSICLWDVGRPGAAVDLQPSLFIQEAHKGAVEDVDWHRSYDFLFGSVGDDRAVHLWDCRTEPKSASNTIVDAHAGDAHCLSFNHYSEFLLATGGADKCVCLWDLRKLKERVHKFEGHEGEVMSVAWSPFGALTLASGGSDRKVVVWDVDKIGKEQSAEDAEDGPPELFFSHGGHTARVSELSWNTNEEYVFASVDEDNSLQVWQMVRRVYACACAWARSFACACLCAGEGRGGGF